MSFIKLKKPVFIKSCAAVVGKREFEGPLGGSFDLHDETERFGMDTWEKAESEMQRRALLMALKKGKTEKEAIDVIFAGDLMNQCTASAYGLSDFFRPYFGLYGACSTFAEALMLASLTVSAGYFQNAACVSSSHFCTAERQFRMPLEYGGQRTPTSQRTATAAGAAILSDNAEGGVCITDVMPGRIVDKKIKDLNNMGAAMAPAAMDTILRYFSESGKKPTDFDLIVTGDLGKEGHEIVSELLSEKGMDLGHVYNDCGLMLYGLSSQDMHAGGSGCGCSASVVSGYIIKEMLADKYSDVLYIATGALMSPSSVYQGLSIPAIAHLVHFSKEAK